MVRFCGGIILLPLLPNTYTEKVVPYPHNITINDVIVEQRPNAMITYYWQTDNLYVRQIEYNSSIPALKHNIKVKAIRKVFDLITNEVYEESISYSETNIIVANPYSNFIRLDVVNNISKDQYIPSGSQASTLIGDQAIIRDLTGINPSIFNSNYQWQKRLVKNIPGTNLPEDWVNINGANGISYTPTEDFTITTQYRRLIIENPNDLVSQQRTLSSNVVTIYPVNITDQIDNTICCDQSIYLNEPTNPLTTSIVDSKYVNQWQVGTMINNEIKWVDMMIPIYSTSYTPARPSRLRGNITSYYRRNLKNINPNIDYSYFLSNIVSVTYYNSYNRPSGRMNYDITNDPEISIYPNPALSTITISNISDYQIEIVNLAGEVVFLQERKEKFINLLDIDISKFTPGIYNIIFTSPSDVIRKKIIKL
ncbi:MAG TPA: T9SS type A sorting domain-containing protein [Flavobacterium sp.]